eukprot:m.15915 g.15915  ORF g.15915 m.15915 type:complete len:116 (-) comp10523_c0_seq5:2221-2568(-)
MFGATSPQSTVDVVMLGLRVTLLLLLVKSGVVIELEDESTATVVCGVELAELDAVRVDDVDVVGFVLVGTLKLEEAAVVLLWELEVLSVVEADSVELDDPEVLLGVLEALPVVVA